ncbi:MAG: 2OG-Fe(II) oxygenase [Lautropia sp.]|nr:2OG-Fe(II) oxygenase [Lautropia sp.]
MMKHPVAPQIVQCLEDLTGKADGSKADHFGTCFKLKPDFELTVEGIGPIEWPVSRRTAHALCGMASPAMHGYRDETRLDRNVRDTWEIPASALRLEGGAWTRFLKKVMTRVTKDLAIPAGASLRAELHNLLVYERGQFFALHQDSEKLDGMVGTLVLTLPSFFEGGEFVLRHGQKRISAKGSPDKVEVVAFYADCHHEVMPVEEGFRVVLTFNLVMEGNDTRPASSADPLSAEAVSRLSDTIRTFWQTKPLSRWHHDDRDPPERLVLLLDHQYTEAGLDWSRLKGEDARMASALKLVAQQLDADIFLTLADVHQIWSAEEPYRRRYWEDEQAEGEVVRIGNQRYVLQDLIDDDVILTNWLDAEGRRMDFAASHVTDAEICMTTGHEELVPYHADYEGYMGNYGNTLDRWYHRAALVMWPRSKGFVLRARQDPVWAMAQILAWWQSGDADRASACLHALKAEWRSAVLFAGRAQLPEATFPVAVACRDADTAAWLLDHFQLIQLPANVVPWVEALHQVHGVDWLKARLQCWYREGHTASEARQGWMSAVLPSWLARFRETPDEGAAAVRSLLLGTAWQDVWDQVMQARQAHGGQALIEKLLPLARPLAGLLQLGVEEGGPSDVDHFLEALRDETLPIDLQVGVLAVSIRQWMDREGLRVDTGDEPGTAPGASGRRSGRKKRSSAQEDIEAARWMAQAAGMIDAYPSSAGALSHLAVLHQQVTAWLSTRLAQPERAPDDWSIHVPMMLQGELGAKLMAFLNDPSEKRLVWPLAKDRRMTVHRFIDHHELPLTHVTERTGSPHKLILEKRPNLHEREARQRRLWAHDFQGLSRLARLFAAP